MRLVTRSLLLTCILVSYASISYAESDADTKKAIADLVPQVKVVNAYMQLIPATAAFVNDAKSLSVNYLEDNRSISSIPRNFQALVDRHLQWIAELNGKVGVEKATIAAIIDLPTYRSALTQIDGFNIGCKSDTVLSTAEERLVGDLTTITSAINALEQRGMSLIDSLNDPRFSGIGDPTLVTNIRSTVDALKTYVVQIEASRQQLIAQGQKRAVLCGQIPKVCLSAAEAQLRHANVEHADKLIASIEAELRGPRVYAMVVAATSNALYAIDYPLNNLYAPIHAERALYAAKPLIPDLRQTVMQASIGSMQEQATAVIDQFQQRLISREASVKNDMARRASLGKERQRLIRLILARKSSADLLTSDCATLANAIVTAKTDLDSAEAEESYIKFATNCRKH